VIGARAYAKSKALTRLYTDSSTLKVDACKAGRKTGVHPLVEQERTVGEIYSSVPRHQKDEEGLYETAAEASLESGSTKIGGE